MKLRCQSIAAAFMAVTATFLSGCKQTPSGVLDSDDMAELLADLEIAESVVETAPSEWRGDSMKMLLRQSVYARHGVSSETVDSSLSWYGHNIEKYPEVYDRVTEILEARMKEARNAGAAPAMTQNIVTEDGDSVDIWSSERTWRFAGKMRPSEVITFNVNRDRNFELGDAYILKFKVVGGVSRIRSNITGEYTSGMKDYTQLDRRGQGWYNLSLSLDSTTIASRIYGSIGITPGSAQTVYVDSVSLVRIRMKDGRKLKISPRYRITR